MKIAFVTHDVGIYGAPRSLRTLLSEINKQHDIHIIIPNSFSNKPNIDDVSKWFDVDRKKIHRYFLPFSFCYVGKPHFSLKYSFFLWIKKIKWFLLDRIILYIYFMQESFDIIHLNSIILHEILCRKFNMILHVREVFDGSSIFLFKNIVKAKGVIFIDLTTYKQFKDIKLNDYIVLLNPFDMTGLNKFLNANYLLEFPKSIDWENKIIFTIIGRLEEVKGILFVLNVFKDYKNTNALLLIVGAANDKEYFLKCQEVISTDPRIIYYGEEKEIEKIYYISDYLLRGESFACIGRTTYEALYSGLHIIVPGDKVQDEEIFFDYNLFSEKIHFYIPRNYQALMQSLNICNKKVKNKKYISNAEQYAKSYINFISKKNYPKRPRFLRSVSVIP